MDIWLSGYDKEWKNKHLLNQNGNFEDVLSWNTHEENYIDDAITHASVIYLHYFLFFYSSIRDKNII